MKRVRDDGAVGERERGSELSVDFSEEDRPRRSRGAVEFGQASEPLLVSGGCESKRHTSFSRYRLRLLSSTVR